MKKYFYTEGKEKFGPFSLKELEQKIQLGELNASTLIWYEGIGDWIHAQNVEELKPLFPELPQTKREVEIRKKISKSSFIIMSILVLLIAAILYRTFSPNSDYHLLDVEKSGNCNPEQIALIKAYSKEYIRAWLIKNRNGIKDIAIKLPDEKGKFNCDFYAVKNGFIEAKLNVDFSDNEGKKHGIITYKLSRNTFLKTLKEEVLNFTETKKKAPETKSGKSNSNKPTPKKTYHPKKTPKKEPEKTRQRYHNPNIQDIDDPDEEE